MPGNPQIPTGAAFATRLAVFYAAFFVALGVQVPFLPVWLAAKGLSEGAIGIALAIPMLVRVVAIPLATRAADQRDALRAAIVITATAGMLGYGLIGLAQGATAIMAAFALASAFYTPIIPLTDAYAVRGSAAVPLAGCGCGARLPSSAAASLPAFCSMSWRRVT